MHPINETHIELFRKIVGEAYVLTADEVLVKYATDQTERLFFMPQVVIKPRSAEEISEILKICNQYQIPVTPRGGGTGLSGGALPVEGGVVLATERMNNILKIDEKNLQVHTEPGVITEILQEAVKEKNLFFPPDPASKGSCFIGGNITENSGGPKAIKYGVVNDYVLNLEVVLPTGEIIWTGANTLKNVTGYNLTQLIVGSEGTLGIVTKIVLKLIPMPKHDLTMFTSFTTLEKACEAVNLILMNGFNPCGLELMEIEALKMAALRTPHQLPIHENLAACLIIEVDGNNADQLMNEMESIAQLLAELDPVDILVAEDSQQKEELWKLRRRVAEIVKAAGYTIEEDTVVPRAALAPLIKGVKQLAKMHDFQSVCYGHAGDGNIHVRIKKEGKKNSLNDPVVNNILRALFRLVKKLGGTISAEHGIGLVQKSFLDIVMSEKQIQLMQDIKKVFDPNNILNPGKIFN